jgi:hydrogenase maturation factor HypE
MAAIAFTALLPLCAKLEITVNRHARLGDLVLPGEESAGRKLPNDEIFAGLARVVDETRHITLFRAHG